MKNTAALILILILAATGVAWAQGKPSWEWPRTFSGQPDFEFTKEDVLQERAKILVPQGLPAPKAPTLANLLDDEKVNPLVAMAAAAVSRTSVAGGDDVSATETMPKMDFELAFNNLPSLTTVRELDLSEFRTSLRRTIRQEVENYRFRPGSYGLEHMLKNLTLQAVVTSPYAYAVINDKQYRQGESFTVPVKVGPSDADFLDALAAKLPAEGSMSEEQALKYRDVYEEVVKELANQRAQNPASLQKAYPMPATIVEVKHRKVILDFNGQRHELAIRFAY